jgi:hypothetical protein
VPLVFAEPAGSSNALSSAVTECWADPDHVHMTVSPAVIVVVVVVDIASVNELSAMVTFAVAADDSQAWVAARAAPINIAALNAKRVRL